MAKKKGQGSGDKKKGAGPSKKKSVGKKSDAAPSSRARGPNLEKVMEDFLQQLSGSGSGGRVTKAQAALQKAQDLIHEAFETESDLECIALAQQALNLSPDCADAYVLLAELAPSLPDALKLYEEGVAAGERALGKKAFREMEGQFWGFLETRPYMRAMFGKAQCLWSAGRRDDAIDTYRKMLLLNPNDNQGVRYLLASGLLEAGADDELARLQEQYRDTHSADWLFNQALLLFRREGDSPAARRALADAQKFNGHVAAYLLGYQEIPVELPPYVSPGNEDEAIAYAATGLGAWKSTPGAITWLREVSGVMPPEPPYDAPRGDDELVRLPQDDDEIWQADLLAMPEGALPFPDMESDEDEPDEERSRDLWVLFVTNPVDDQIVSFELVEEEPDPELAWEIMGDMMFQTRGRPAHRPARIEVRSPELYSGWREHAERINVELVRSDDLPHLDSLASEFVDRAGQFNRLPFEQGAPPSPDEITGLTQEIGEAWLVDVFRLPMWIDQDGTPQRPWTILVLNGGENTIVAQRLEQREPTPAIVGDVLLSAMKLPVMGQPHRPTRVLVRSADWQQGLESRMEEVDVECVVGEDFTAWDSCLESLASHLAHSEGMPTLFGTPGLSPEKIASFYQAAAEFYRDRPWQRLPGDLPLRIDVDQFQSKTWYAVVMGQHGVTLGLALYDDSQTLGLAIQEGIDEEEFARRSSSLALTYGEAFEVSQVDLFQGERRHWELAGPEAYPLVVRANPGKNVRSPLAWELQLLEACLRALPVHLRNGYQGRREHSVETGNGPVKVVIDDRWDVPGK